MADRMHHGGVAERQRGQESHGVVEAVKDLAQTAGSSVESAAEKAWETTTQGAQKAASAVAHTAEDTWDSVRSCMSRYPVATFFVGVGVGALIAFSLERR